MSDESRSADGLIAAVAALRQELEDFKTTQNARTFRGPTGDIGHTLSATPRPDTLFLDGQTVSRETYAALWAWAQGQGLAGTVFGNGDGSTTFVMPDLKGRVFVHQDAVTPVGTKFGADSLILTAAQMPVHTHTVNNHSNHNHPLTGGSVPSGGNHDGHFPGNAVNVGSGAGTVFGLAAWNSSGVDSGNHGHGAVAVFSDQVALSAHVVGNAGSGAAFDNRQASFVGNIYIWT